MANVYRGRWDSVANPKSLKDFAVLAADVIEVGDLCWLDRRTQTVKAFSHADAWTGTLAGSQAKVAENFVGVANSAHVAGDLTNLRVRVAAMGVFAHPVTTPTTFEIGDYVTPSKDPAYNLLLAQAIDKAALGAPGEPTIVARSLAIGRVAVKHPATTPIVEYQIQGVLEPGASPRQYLTS